MRNWLVIICCFIAMQGFSQELQNEIKGTVSDGTVSLFQATVKVKDKQSGVSTDKNGKYVIRAQAGDVLVFSFVGKQTVEIIVEDVTTILNIELQPFVEELDEVVVSKRKNRFSQKDLSIAYATDSTIVNTSLGYLNPDTAFYEFYTLAGDDFKGSGDVIEAVRRKLHGIRVKTIQNPVTWQDEKAIFITPRNGARAIFEVDGVLMRYTPIGIKMKDVLRVGVMYGAQAEIKFGKIAIGGVIFINTKNGTHGAREGNTNLPYDRAKLRSNIYRNNAVTTKGINLGIPNYLQELQASLNLSEAKNNYEKYEQSFKNAPYFFIDAYHYFAAQGYSDFADEIRAKHTNVVSENPIWLKAWAYYLEANQQFDLATTLYEEIYALRPNYVQSYLDLANGYRNKMDYKKATAMYARYNYLVTEGMLQSDSAGISTIIKREAENLVEQKAEQLKTDVNFNKTESNFTNIGDTRLVFEWNDSEAEFELQFVNPQKHYHIWEHTREANQNRINDEKIKGYFCEEFFVDASLLGNWKVNVNYKGNKKLTPAYLKASIYYNYGSTSQKKEVKVFRLGLRNVNQHLFDLYNAPRISAN